MKLISKGKQRLIVAGKKINLIIRSFRIQVSRPIIPLRNNISTIPQRFNIDIDLGSSPSTVMVAGSSRSGSTWIANEINHANNYRLIFEPFHHGNCNYMEQFPDPIFFPTVETISLEQKRALDKIFRGKIQSPWVNKFNRRIFSTKRVIKSTRVHYLLEWIWDTYHIPIIYILRHPLAVVASRMRFFEIDSSWAPKIQPYLQNEFLMKSLNNEQTDLFLSASTPFQQHLILWCLANFFALQQLSQIRHCLVYYENFHLDPVLEMKRVYKFLGIPFRSKNADKIRKLSEIRYIDIDKSKSDSISKWNEIFGDDEIAQTSKYLQAFSLEKHYTGFSSFPIKGGAG